MQTTQWAFTWNNYETADVARVCAVLGTRARYIFGEERGRSDTPHLQGAVRFDVKQRFSACKKLFGDAVHWEKMRQPWSVNVAYCVKEIKGDWGRLHGNIPEASRYTPGEKACMDTEYADVQWDSWQKKVIALCEAEPDSRKIFWFWEPVGGCGKSFLMKWLGMNYRCVLGGGKRADIFHQVHLAMDKDPEAWPQLVLFDIPRSSLKWCSYTAMEELKNGTVNASKYDGGQYRFPKPQVIVFANSPPQWDEMSADRWCVRRLRVKRTVGEALRGEPASGAGGRSFNMV